MNLNPRDFPDEGVDESPLALALSLIMFFVLIFWFTSPASPIYLLLTPPRAAQLNHLLSAFFFILAVVIPLTAMGLVMRMVSTKEQQAEFAYSAGEKLAKRFMKFAEQTAREKERKAETGIRAGIEGTEKKLKKIAEKEAEIEKEIYGTPEKIQTAVEAKAMRQKASAIRRLRKERQKNEEKIARLAKKLKAKSKTGRLGKGGR